MRPLANASSLGEVCIFCSTRLRFSSVHFTSRTQRKLLHASYAPNKPPVAATATQEQISHIPRNGEVPKQKSSLSGGWAKKSPTIDLTPEEAAMRSRLKQNQLPSSSPEPKPRSSSISAAQPPLPRRTTAYQSRPKRDPSGRDSFPPSVPLVWTCDKCQALNGRNDTCCQICHPSRKRVDPPQWQCTSCGCHNPRKSKRCTRCNSFNAMLGTEPSKDLGNYNRPATTGQGDVRNIFEDDRRRRLEQTKDGRFVGFRPIRNQEKSSRHLQLPEIAATQHQKSPNDPSLTRQSFAQYTPVGVPQNSPLHAAVAEPPGSIQTPAGTYVSPEDLDKPPLRIFPQDGRARIRNKPRDTVLAAPDYHRQRPRRSRRIQDDYDEENSRYDDDREEARKQRKAERKKAQAMQKRRQPPTPIYLPEFISVGNLARVLRVRVNEFARKMEDLGFEETNNDHILDAEVAGLIAVEFNFEPKVDKLGEDQNLQARPPAEDASLLPPRPPVVTIMGHVDHGKTTLLDFLRKSSVAASEHGGITQHIGAFSVSMPGGRLVTFLDTPGHAAFLSMRQRGANVTDIVVLVVAADDSVKPQTVEAIKHAQAAKVPMIVAINKIDKEDKNIDRVKQDLARYNVEIEDYGGETQVVCVSGKTGQGLDSLEENIVALADMLDMRAEADGQAEGWILEAATKKAGRVATVLVRRGTISRGDIIVAGTTWAKIRTLKNEAGVQIAQAGPGTPVEVDGWKDQPAAGDEVLQATSEQQAKTAIDYRLAKIEREQMATDMSAVNESRRLEHEKRDALANGETDSSASTATSSESASPATPVDSQSSTSTAAETNASMTLPVILKADVSGSVEACLNAVTALGTSAVSPQVLRSSVGPISESDIAFAASSGAHIVSFNQKTPLDMYRLAEKGNVKLVEENIIYRLNDLVKTELQNLLPEKVEVRVVGEAEVAKGFEISAGGRKKAMVAGCRVRNGVVSRANKVKVLRGGEGGEVVFDGVLSSLRIVKKDVTEARKGGECGLAFEGWQGFKEGDMVQCYEEKRVKQIL